MKIAMLSREYRGLAEAGGVKDVVRSLSEALVKSGVEVTVFLPMYGFMKPEQMGFRRLPLELDLSMDYAAEERRERVRFWQGREAGVDLMLVESPRFGEKLGVYTYTAVEETADPAKRRGEGHFDYFAMNILLQKGVMAYFLAAGERPSVFHCHDGHTAVLPAMINEIDGFRHFLGGVASLVTIHNAGIGYHQEVGDLPFAKANTSLPWRVIYSSLLNGAFDPLVAGPSYGMVNTVSENYARELQETELDAMTGWLGHALKERGIKIQGITNGIDPDAYNPSRPDALGLPAGFDPEAGDMEGKRRCRRALFSRMREGIKGVKTYGSPADREGWPLLTVVSRLTEQKGMDVLAQALEGLIEEREEFVAVILGTGEPHVEQILVDMAVSGAGQERMVVNIGYSQELANLIYASGDFFVIPSMYEPCGLTDFIAQLMGNIPVVHATGGLVKVQDGFNGFSYVPHEAGALKECLRRALSAFRDYPRFLHDMRINAVRRIKQEYTWEKVGKRYLELYRRAGAEGS